MQMKVEEAVVILETTFPNIYVNMYDLTYTETTTGRKMPLSSLVTGKNKIYSHLMSKKRARIKKIVEYIIENNRYIKKKPVDQCYG